MAGYMYLGSQRVCPAVLIKEKAYNIDGYDLFGKPDANGVLQDPTDDIELNFEGVKNIPNSSFANRFNRSGIGARVVAFLFQDLEECGDYAFSYIYYANTVRRICFDKLRVVGNWSFDNSFQTSLLEYVEFPSLISVGTRGFFSTFTGSTNIETARFQKLESLGNRSFYGCFSMCTGIKDIYFNSLKTTSFGDNLNALESIVLGVTGATLHFPSNLTGVIPTLTSYPNFSGTNTVILYDLEATE